MLPVDVGPHSFAATTIHVQAAPVELTLDLATDMTLVGGWEKENIYDGSPVILSFVRSGGRRVHTQIDITLRNQDGVTKTVTLPQNEGDPNQFAGELSFEADQRGAWTIDVAATTIEGIQPVSIATEDRFATLMVSKNWWPIIIAAALAVLALIIAIWLYIRSLPRWADELLILGGQPHAMHSAGKVTRNTSDGADALAGSLTFTKQKTGVEVALNADKIAACWLNGAAISRNSDTLMLAVGSDIEVESRANVHVRFFDAAHQRKLAVVAGAGQAGCTRQSAFYHHGQVRPDECCSR